MLHDGKFVKEPPPQIGKFYVPNCKDRLYTREELFAQDVVLGGSSKTSILTKVLGLMLRI